jgi:hypothetical protein
MQNIKRNLKCDRMGNSNHSDRSLSHSSHAFNFFYHVMYISPENNLYLLLISDHRSSDPHPSPRPSTQLRSLPRLEPTALGAR